MPSFDRLHQDHPGPTSQILSQNFWTWRPDNFHLKSLIGVWELLFEKFSHSEFDNDDDDDKWSSVWHMLSDTLIFVKCFTSIILFKLIKPHVAVTISILPLDEETTAFQKKN